eukprot:Seg292.12 transcript_id=Seg292.12/GoldUCD/mRNA.D3Y31 product="hypothetical protein" protein_id=Seg292.12/GoldUCD/D3Y31
MAKGSDEFSDVPNLSAQTPTRRESQSRNCKRKRIYNAEEDDKDLLAFLLDSEEETMTKAKPNKKKTKPANNTGLESKTSNNKKIKAKNKPGKAKKVVPPKGKKEAEKKRSQKKDGQRKCNKKTKILKNAFHGMVKWLNKIPTSEAIQFVKNFTDEERHLDRFEKRRLMIDSLIASNEIEKIIKILRLPFS